jgi:hypothetical protein
MNYDCPNCQKNLFLSEFRHPQIKKTIRADGVNTCICPFCKADLKKSEDRLITVISALLIMPILISQIPDDLPTYIRISVGILSSIAILQLSAIGHRKWLVL